MADQEPIITDDDPIAAGTKLREAIVENIKQVFDPEIPVNVYELGLIYNIDIDVAGKYAKVTMTLTSPNCPSAQELPLEVEQRTLSTDGIDEADVEIVWDPPWSPDLMSEEAKLELGFL
ncbi:MAG: iron-sulfur cluster assembly protein [Sumerlaeia bacterium]